MNTKDFNIPARNKQQRLVLEAMAHFASDPNMVALSKRIRAHEMNGPTITLYKGGEIALRAVVAFKAYNHSLRFDALHILLDYLEATKANVEWEAVSLSPTEEIIPRKSDVARMSRSTSDIAHYASLGLQDSLREIKRMPAERQKTSLFNAFLANTSVVRIYQADTSGKRMTREQFDNMLVGTVADALGLEPKTV